MSQLIVTALTAFYGSEGMWQEGDAKLVSAGRAQELEALGLVKTRPAKPGEGRETKPDVGPDSLGVDLTTAVIKPAAAKPRTIETK